MLLARIKACCISDKCFVLLKVVPFWCKLWEGSGNALLFCSQGRNEPLWSLYGRTGWSQISNWIHPISFREVSTLLWSNEWATRLVASVISDVQRVQPHLCLAGSCYILSIWFNSRWAEIGGLNITFPVACSHFPESFKVWGNSPGAAMELCAWGTEHAVLNGQLVKGTCLASIAPCFHSSPGSENV